MRPVTAFGGAMAACGERDDRLAGRAACWQLARSGAGEEPQGLLIERVRRPGRVKDAPDEGSRAPALPVAAPSSTQPGLRVV
ncbi:MAG: hypothetical protein AAGE83_08655, partial [Pseudomonadota bacterium]